MTDTVLFLSHSHQFGSFRVGSHHLAGEFARAGYRVVHVSTPYSVVHRLLGRGSPEQMRAADAALPHADEHGVLHMVPHTLLPVPWTGSGYLTDIMKNYLPDGARFIFVDQPKMGVRRIAEMGATVIYRPTDLYLAGVAARVQERLVRAVDGIAATSAEVLRRLCLPEGTPTVVIENGVEFTHFSRRHMPLGHERSGVIYVGALDDRFDWPAVRSLAEAYPDVDFDIIGPLPATLPSVPGNVRLLGPRKYAELPRLLSTRKVGLLPLSGSPLNVARSPMKLFEYLACGLFVLAKATPTLAAAAASGVSLYETYDDAVVHLGRALGAERENHVGIAEAKLQDWGEKMRALERFALSVERAKVAA